MNQYKKPRIWAELEDTDESGFDWGLLFFTALGVLTGVIILLAMKELGLL